MFQRLSDMGMECIPSQGNFISFRGPFNADELFINLMKEGVIVRPIGLYDMPEFIRVTIGTKDENDYFLQKLSEILQHAALSSSSLLTLMMFCVLKYDF